MDDLLFDPLIETSRLYLTPLDPRQLGLWVNDMPALEAGIGCKYRAEPMEGFFKEIVAGQLKKALADEENYRYHSFWLMIRKDDRVVVGSADFKGPPDENGEVELGYGIAPEFEHQGYMTEAARAMCCWALSRSGVRAVIAETDADGLASQRVLERCGFSCFSRGETYWWRLDGQKLENRRGSLIQHSAGMILYRKSGDNIEYLLLFQSGSRTWSVPKGHLEPREDELAAARREVQEETGFSLEPEEGFRQELTYPLPGGGAKTVAFFLAELEDAPRLEAGEVERAVWAGWEEAARLLRYARCRRIFMEAESYIRRGDIRYRADAAIEK